nr:hypothetical protein OG296_22240 [Streptomyces sp. NBC_01001]
MATGHAPLAVAFILVATAALAGCAEQKKAAAPHLPERTCFGVFTRADLEPLMGNGEEVKELSPIDVRLTAERRGATCNVYVDGQGRFLASATRQPLGQHFFWSTDSNQPTPDSLALGDKGIVWNTGADVALTCKGTKESFELELSLSGSIEHMKKGESRPLFTKLMTKFLDAAKEQTQCGS